MAVDKSSNLKGSFKCLFCNRPIKKIFLLPRTKSYYARQIYSCGSHLYMKFFKAATADKEMVNKLLFIDAKGILPENLYRCDLADCELAHYRP